MIFQQKQNSLIYVLRQNIKPLMQTMQNDNSLINESHRRVSFQQELVKNKSQRYQNTGILRLKIMIVCLSTFYFGYSLNYLSVISTATMIQQFGQNSQQSTVKGFLIGVLSLGAAVGAIVSPFIMKCLSRKNHILVINIIALIIQGILQYPNLINLFVCRVIQGFLIGNFMAIVPLYINQITPKQIIGNFGVYTQLFATFGMTFAYAIGIIMTKAGLQNSIMWRIQFGFNILTILFVIINLLLKVIPQSPNSLILKGQHQQAKKVINLFIKDEYVEQVFKQKLLQVQSQKISQPDNQKQKLVYSKKAYFIGFQLPLMQQLTGVNAIVTQIGGIASQHNPTFGYYTPLIVNFVQFIATFGSIWALKTFGRKTVLVAGNVALGVYDILLGVLFLFIQDSDAIFWVVFVILIIYMVSYSTTIGPAVWLYVPQIIPAKMVPFATSLNWLGCFFAIIILPIINQKLGDSAVFFLFGILTIITAVINIFAVVQIKGMNLKQICAAYH